MNIIFILTAVTGIDGENEFSVEEVEEGTLVPFEPPSGEFGRGSTTKCLNNLLFSLDLSSSYEHIKSLTKNLTRK